MQAFFKEIFEYHHHFNLQLITQLEEHQASLPNRTIPLFCHILNAHQIWNARIMGTAPFGVREEHALDLCKSIDQKNYTDTIKILEELDISATLNYQNSKGVKFQNTIRDILFHVANHSTHHKGQIISDFRQSGITPLVTDYIFFKR